MKHFYVAVLILVLLKFGFVKPNDDKFNYLNGNGNAKRSTEKRDDIMLPDSQKPSHLNKFDAKSFAHLTTRIETDCKSTMASVYVTIYVMASVIVILCVIVIGLLIFIHKLKKKAHSEYDDTTKITKTDSPSKYARQSSENEVIFTRENSNDDSRFKLTRQKSNMSILEYPKSQDMNKKTREEPQTSAITPLKLKPANLKQKQIEEICRAVILKSQQRNEYTSLTNLDKIVNEGKTKESDNTVIEKSVSSGLLDDIDSSEVSPSGLTVKKVINNFEILSSPVAPRKLNKLIDNKPTTINKSDSKAQDASSLPFRLLPVNTVKKVETVIENNVYDPPQVNRHVSSSYSVDEIVDDIYVDPPNNRPVSFDKDDDEDIDDVYDNPPNNKPVGNTCDTHLDDIYDDPPNNKSVFHDAVVGREEIYDNVTSENYLTDKESLLKQNSREDNITKRDDVYDFPSLSSTGIAVTNDDHSGYSTTLTSAKEPFFDSNYVNARSFNCQ